MSKATEKTLVPKLRFPEFRDAEEWEEKPLNLISTSIFDGTHQTPKYTEDGIPFFSVENIVSGKPNKFISREDYLTATSKNKPEKGDVLITRIGNIGFSAIVDWEYEFSIYVTLAVVKKSDQFDSYYLYSFLQSERYQTEIRSKSLLNAVPCKINMDELRKSRVSLPSPPEQQKIADCLSSIDELITVQAQKIESLKAHKKGMMQKLFSLEIRFKDDNGNPFPDWEEKKLGEISKTITGSSNREDSTEEGDYAFFDRSNDQRASSKFLFDCEAIIVAGEGKDFPPRYFVGKFDLHQRAYATMKFKKNIGKYVFYWMHHHRSFLLKYSVGSTMPSLRMNSFSEFPVQIPHPDEQQKIANCLSSIDDLITAQAQKIESLKAHKKGMMQQLFPIQKD